MEDKIKKSISEKEVLQFLRNPLNWQDGLYYTEETLKKAAKLFIKEYGR